MSEKKKEEAGVLHLLPAVMYTYMAHMGNEMTDLTAQGLFHQARILLKG